MIRAAVWLLVVFSAIQVCRAADDAVSPPQPGKNGAIKIIKPEEAKNHLDQRVTVEFTVQAARELLDKNIAFLNSEKNLKSPTNFTAFLSSKGLKKLKGDFKIEKPAVHFFKKKVQVTGKVVLFKDKLEIVVDSPQQIKIVEEEQEKGGDRQAPPAAP